MDTRRMILRGRDFRDAMADLRFLRAALLPEPEELSTDPWRPPTPPWLHLLDDLSLCTHRNQVALDRRHQRSRLQKQTEAAGRAVKLRRVARRRATAEWRRARQQDRDLVRRIA
ncbi:unnamed protein product [Symbiodinium natans]|uniref:Uncharacterized protein n=1 Tax=Symbiodinium natans TaxID=878477 RepID=A0A812LY64_9DINO|nr:unnamed protein product [Symbiodinium natans]